MYKLFFISFLSVFITTISTTAFEDSNPKKDLKIVYNFDSRQFELQLDYCNSYDSFTINKLYSEKKIESIYPNHLIINKDYVKNHVLVNIKTKPIKPLHIKQSYEKLVYGQSKMLDKP